MTLTNEDIVKISQLLADLKSDLKKELVTKEEFNQLKGEVLDLKDDVSELTQYVKSEFTMVINHLDENDEKIKNLEILVRESRYD